MAAQKVTRAAKQHQELDEDELDFAQQQRQIEKQAKARRDAARAKISKDHGDKHKDLQKRIQALKRRPSSKRPGSGAAPSSDETAYGTLRQLLEQKADLETRIARCIEGLETAVNTTSRELQLILKSRTESAANGSQQ